MPARSERMPSRRLIAVAATALATGLGLATRHWPGAVPALFGKYPGDASWALTVFFAWRALRPRAMTSRIGVLCVSTCAAVEFAKLWQAPWLVQFRHTTGGHLLLGHVFSWQNLVAYAVGALAGLGVDRLLFKVPPACPPMSTR